MIANILLGIGSLFIFLGTIGLFTMEDLYSKIQAVGISDIVGVISILLSLILKYPESSGRLIILSVITIILNPAISSIIAYYAAKTGEKVGKKSNE